MSWLWRTPRRNHRFDQILQPIAPTCSNNMSLSNSSAMVFIAQVSLSYVDILDCKEIRGKILMKILAVIDARDEPSNIFFIQFSLFEI